MTIDDLLNSVETDTAPPAEWPAEIQALWHTKAQNWDAAHDIAQEIHSNTGSWIHALLHLIEGDIGNAGYWFSRAGRPARQPAEINSEWEAIATELLSK